MSWLRRLLRRPPRPEPPRLLARREKGVLVLTVTLREITDEVAGPLRGALLDAVTYGAHGAVVVLDLSRVKHLSSAGTSVLLALKYRLLVVGSKLIIASPPVALVEAIHARYGLQSLFESAPDAAAAVARAAAFEPLPTARSVPFQETALKVGPPRYKVCPPRYSDVSFPPRVQVGKPTNLRVRIATFRYHEHDADLALEFPDESDTLAVTVCVAAENLTVESDPQATLLVPHWGDSPAVQFRLVGEKVGPGRVMVDFDQDGRPVGSVDLAVEVGGQTDEAAPAPTFEIHLSGGRLPAPDVTLIVHEHRYALGRLHFTLFSRHPRLKDLPWVNHGDLGTVELRQEMIGWVERQLALTNGWGEADWARRLADLGNSLHDQVLPERLQALCWSLAERGIHSLLILSDEPHVPWELIKPYRLNEATGRREELPFWGETFALARWLRGRSTVDHFGLDRVSAVVSGAAPVRNLVAVAATSAPQECAHPAGPAPALPGVEEELRAVRNLERYGVEVRVLPPRRREVLAAFEEGEFEVLHVACHGSFAGGAAADASALLLEDGTLRAADLAPRLAALRGRAPLVFLNACQTGLVGYSLTRLGGWGAELIRLGCGAFVGTQWRVTDEVAAEVARAFYEHLVKGVPIAGALHAARDLARSRFPQDPTWLAYTCFADPGASVWPLPTPRLEPTPRVEQARCPYCTAFLPTPRARQCFQCGMDWHDPDNVVCR